ncbi:MAG TPA: hypothetical protein VK663_11175 [Burkholderiales bacterium]|nr:hypothetical protein [Burkholderiales bacterium]
MWRISFMLALTLWWNASQAAAAITEKSEAPKPPAQTANIAGTTKIAAVTSAGPGQAGYVHYFLLTHPDNSLEYQVGIELDDQRIAWSFPEAGVTVSEFIKKGEFNANGKRFKVEHLHGIRPFASDADMQVLRKQLPARVASWVDNETPYCLLRQPGQNFCLSCGDFVVRILYPGAHPLIPALPRDFLRVTGPAYTTDDLLLYMVGLHGLPDRRSMLEKLATMDLPAVMREDIISMIEGGEPDSVATAAVAVRAPLAEPVAQKPVAKPATAGRVATRRQQTKKL